MSDLLRPNIQIYDAHVVDLYQWVCPRYLVGVKGAETKAKAQLSPALDRISERITRAFQTLSRAEAIRAPTIENSNLPYISIGYGGESVSQLPLKDKAFSTFLDQNPPLEQRPGPKWDLTAVRSLLSQRPVIDNNAPKRHEGKLPSRRCASGPTLRFPSAVDVCASIGWAAVAQPTIGAQDLPATLQAAPHQGSKPAALRGLLRRPARSGH
jgi:hypothetical protein